MKHTVGRKVATVSFTLVLRCGERPVLKKQPQTTGDWSLSTKGWFRTRGKGDVFREAGVPFDVMGDSNK